MTGVDEVNRAAESRLGTGGPATMPATVLQLGWCAVLSLLPFLWRAASGTGRLPNDDTWAYERIFAVYHQTGDLQLIDWNDVSLVGMMPVARGWVAVVGNGPYQLHLLGAVMGFLSLLALHLILRCLRSPRQLLVLTIVGLYSGFVMTSGTFMTDMFVLAGAMWSLALVVFVATRDLSPRWQYALAAGAALCSVYAFSVRQQSAVAAMASLIVLLAVRHAVRWGWLLFTLVYGAGSLVFYSWRSGLPNGGGVLVTFNARMVVGGATVMVAVLCLALLPLVLLSGTDRLAVRAVGVRLAASLVAAAGAAAIPVADYISDHTSVLSRIAQAGPVTRVVAAVILANVVVTVVAVIASLPVPGERVVKALTLGVAAAVLGDVFTIVVGGNYYGRYSIFTLAVAASVLSVTLPVVADRRIHVGAWATAAAVGLAAFWTLDGTLALTNVTEEAGDAASCAGIPADRLDAGLVWMGTHTTGVVNSRYLDSPLIDDGLPRTQHQRAFPDARRDGVAVVEEPGDVADGVLIGRFTSGGLLPGNTFEQWLIVRPEFAAAAERCQ